MRNILVTGATSIVGRYLMPLLEVRSDAVMAVSRNSHTFYGATSWICTDIGNEQLPAETRHADTLIHLAPLPLLDRLLVVGKLPALRRIIAIGTTSIFTKMQSPVRSERDAMNAQCYAEQTLFSRAVELGYRWTLLRPTLVYDGLHDKNVAHIARFIARFGFFPIVNPATGLRQPLHADDLAGACIDILDNPLTEMKAYNLAGNQILSYREMVEQIFRALGKQPKIVSVPFRFYQAALALVKLYPRFRYINAEMARRMRLDMIFDITPARNDFGFSPRDFHPS